MSVPICPVCKNELPPNRRRKGTIYCGSRCMGKSWRIAHPEYHRLKERERSRRRRAQRMVPKPPKAQVDGIRPETRARIMALPDELFCERLASLLRGHQVAA